MDEPQNELPPDVREWVQRVLQSPNAHVYRMETQVSGDVPPGFDQLFQQGFSGSNMDGLAGLAGRAGFSMPLQQQHLYWLRWDYRPDEWQYFDQADWARAGRTFLIASSIILGPIVLLVAGMLGLVLANIDFIFPSLFVLLFVAIFGSIIYYYRVWLPYREARARHRARQTGPQRVTFGNVFLHDQALWQGGLHVQIQDFHFQLKRVEIGDQPPVLCFHRKYHGFRQYSWRDVVRIPIPVGRVAEAEQLVERFRRETVGVWGKPYNQPPEPN